VDGEGAVQAAGALRRAIGASGNLSLAFGPEADAVLARLRRARRRDPGLRAAFELGWLHWYRQLTLPGGQVGEDGRRAYAELLPCFAQGLEPLPEGLHPDLALGSLNQAAVLLHQAMTAHDSQAIHAAVALWRRIGAAIPPDAAEWPAMMVMLCVALQGRFECTADSADLEDAVAVGRLGVSALPPTHPKLAMLLTNYAAALRMRFDVCGGTGRGYVDEAISVYRRALAATPERGRERAGMLSSLGGALHARFRAFPADGGLAEAISLARQALAAVPGRARERPRYLANLAFMLQTRYAVTRTPADLAESIALLSAALSATPRRHPDHPSLGASLAAAIWVRYGESGEPGDVDAVIGLLREAASGLRAADPARALVLSNLSVALFGRFELVGAAADLDAAVGIGRQAISAAPSGHADLPRYHSNLAVYLRQRGDIPAAAEAGQRAVASSAPGDPELPRRLSNLANAQRDAGELEAAVATMSLAASADQAGTPGIQSNLGLVLLAAGRPGDAVGVLRSAHRTTPPGHPARPAITANLASALRHRLGPSGAGADLAEAMALFAEVAETRSAAPSARARAARAWCQAADVADPGQARRAAGLLTTAAGLLPLIASRRLARGDQQRYLADFGGLASDAAALILAAGGEGSAARALGVLESGRGILLSQALGTRTDLTALRLRHPRLAARYARLCGLLDSEPGERPVASDPGFAGAALALESRAGDRQRLADECAATVSEVRGLAGFSGFMRAPGVDDLLPQARDGPVVVFNVSGYRSDALLLTSGGVTCLPLPALTPSAVRAGVLSLREEFGASLPGVLAWLWEAAAEPVLHALGFGEPVTQGPWPRVWWVASGLLSLLPVHAAGQVMDRVISSYTPTVRALAHARSRRCAVPPSRSLIVAMASPAAGGAGLPWAAHEARSLRSLLPRPTVLMEPAVAEALRGLDGCAIAHFACHGAVDTSDPSRSGLVLAEGALTVAALASVRLDRAQLAYLSACRTAVSDAEGLSDEAIHLASAFALAGFPHVVATLWPIADRAASTFAQAFYAAVRTRSGELSPAHAAWALHAVTRERRRQAPDAPALWAAHIHTGP
jgi:tetratricopeptide (TPR) repeat protein